MKESTKEWLGIKQADLIIYAGFGCLLPVYLRLIPNLDVVAIILGLTFCVVASAIGIKRSDKLGKTNNAIKLIAYPAVTLFYIYLSYYLYFKPINEISDEVNAHNKSAPYMIESETRFDRSFISNKVATFHFTMVNGIFSEYNKEYISIEFIPETKTTICKLFTPKGYYKEGFEVVYKYFDSEDALIAEIRTNHYNCNT
ncbi:MAG: hypothetical protein KZQ93_05225 [Candidatus Thiodiazotropha sp. (ex Monitilora ramsayi)]|nr:hypothetical protein [Candidatus Thiodiazotropha sp. (ex Monitilora ramsayi)]